MGGGSNGDPAPTLRHRLDRHPVRTIHHTTKGNPMNPNSQYVRNQTFGKQQLLNHVPRDVEEERLALQRLNREAPDLVAMILGGVL